LKHNKYQTSFEKFKEANSINKSYLRKVLFQGGFFLLIAIVITYYGKFRPVEKKIVLRHGFLGWVFKQDSSLSVLIVYPNDNDYGNPVATGERLFINPLDSPAVLDTNYIRYNKKDLFLLGRVERFHVRRYCHEVDSLSTLYYLGDTAFASECPGAEPFAVSSNRFSRDWSVRTQLETDSLSRFLSLRVTHKGQSMVFSSAYDAGPQQDSLMLFVALTGGSGALLAQPSRILLAPEKGAREGRTDSSLVLSSSRQTLGFLIQEDGQFVLKKLWLRNQ
jgi:hypothetical protein